MWKRIRFYVDRKEVQFDFRPIEFPPPGPYWCTGFSESDYVLVGYFKTEAQLYEFWPEARLDSVDDKEEIVFTDRFPKPEWFNG